MSNFYILFNNNIITHTLPNMKKRQKIHNKKIGLYNNVNIIVNKHGLNIYDCCFTVKSIYDVKNWYQIVINSKLIVQ